MSNFVRYYNLTDAAALKHRNRIIQLLGAFAATTVITVILGLVRWSEEAYIGVNILLLAVAAVGMILQIRLGGYLDGKPEALKKSISIGVAAGAVVLWLFMTITGLHYALSIVIWIVDVVLAVKLGGALKDIAKNCWNALLPVDIKKGDAPVNCQIMLEGVHTGDALTSPIGNVYIGTNTVLFVLTDHTNGYVLYNADGTVEIRKRKLFGKDTKSGHIDDMTLFHRMEDGTKRIQQFLEDGCAKRNIPVPQMAYSHALFLPNMDVENHVYTEDHYNYVERIPWFADSSKYNQYLQKASKADYFIGKTCHYYKEITDLIRAYDLQFQNDNPAISRTHEELDAIARIIAEACELSPGDAPAGTPDAQHFREKYAAMQKKDEENRS